MQVRLLSPYPEELALIIERAGDHVASDAAEFFVSYGHQDLIREPMLTEFKGRIINIHISMLPWNRGAHPNFWSWFDGTPKGVTIHYIDAGMDTGDIIAQRAVAFDDSETLATSYVKLRQVAVDLFREQWPLIRAGTVTPRQQPHFGSCRPGSFHYAREITPFWGKMPLGWDTPVREVRRMGLPHHL